MATVSFGFVGGLRLARGLFILAMSAVGAGVAADESNVVKLPSPYAFTETLGRLETALGAKGIRIFARIDHQAGAQALGIEMRPSTVLIFGNPQAGTPLMQAAPDFALALPLRVLVREDAAGQTWLVFERARALEGRYGLPAGMTERLAPAEKVLVAAIQPGHQK